MRRNALVPIGRVVPRRIAARNRCGELIELLAAQNSPRGMNGNSAPGRVSLPMTVFPGAVYVLGIVNLSAITKGNPVFRFRKGEEKGRSDGQENSDRQQTS